MGVLDKFSKPKNGNPHKTAKTYLDDSKSSFGSADSSFKSPVLSKTTGTTLENPSFSPFSPKTKAPVHKPQVALPRPPDPRIDPSAYLRSLNSVRERCSMIRQKAERNQLNHFDVDMSKFADVTKFVVSIIKRDFAPDYSEIPAHGRWQHFNVGNKDRITHLLHSWPTMVDNTERTRRLIDLFLVSVLIDAGAGAMWSYKSKENGKSYRRSEGLAVASLEMFKTGIFSSDESQPFRVDSEGLRRLTVKDMARGLQISEGNPMPGLEGRANLLMRLSEALRGNEDFFGFDARPGNMVDYLIAHPATGISSVPVVPLTTLWHVLMDGLAPIWPASRTQVDGISLGDAWPLSTMPRSPPAQPWETIVPFHKLTQWLCYSLMQPMSIVMKIHFDGANLMTGLPEYRNGGLFIDMGVLTLKEEEAAEGIQRFKQDAGENKTSGVEVVPMFDASDDVVVEWRAVTVGFLDTLLRDVNRSLGLSGSDALSLPQMLEAGSWKGGREIAEMTRPNTKEPPIMIVSDGTIF